MPLQFHRGPARKPQVRAVQTRRRCWALVALWSVFAAAVSGYVFLSSTLPVTTTGEPPLWGPAPIQVIMYVAVFVGLAWGGVLIPVLLLGLAHQRAVQPRFRWALAWAGAVAAGVVLEVLYFTGIGYPVVPQGYAGPALVSWGQLWVAVGFLVVGALMLAVLRAPKRR
jgi:hypothetical protein